VQLPKNDHHTDPLDNDVQSFRPSLICRMLRRKVLEGPGETDPAPRQRMAAGACGGPPIETPYDDLARQIGEAACRTTDAQVASVLAVARSEKVAFELIAAAATGAGLLRWQQAIRALEATSDAPA
jgi:hypothetical protein